MAGLALWALWAASLAGLCLGSGCRQERSYRYTRLGWLSNPRAGTEAECCQACEAEAQCVVYQWAASQCRLASSFANRITAFGYNSGFPQRPSSSAAPPPLPTDAGPTTPLPGPSPCASAPCYNGGTCLPTSLHNFTCACPGNLTGPRCDYVLECHPGQVDLFFVLDSSGSIGADHFQDALRFIVSLVDQAQISRTQVGLLQFTDYYYVQFYLNAHRTKAAIDAAILKTPYKSGGTDIATGMRAALRLGFTAAHGDRPDYPDVMVILTDGKDNSNVAYYQRQAAARNITVIAVGVGDDIDRGELERATGSAARVYTTSSFTNLSQIVERVCTAIQVVHPCGSQPCQNGGSCVEVGEDFVCHCPPGLDGKLCQHRDPCHSQPCLHGGTCRDQGQFSFTCLCPHGWTGPRCSQPLGCHPDNLDLELVVDSSASMGTANFHLVKSFLEDLVGTLAVGQTESRVGLVEFSSRAEPEFFLDSYWTSAGVKAGIQRAPYLARGTNIAEGMRVALRQGLVAAKGDRPASRDVMLVVTDGQDGSDVWSAQREAAGRGVGVVAVGVGPASDLAQLRRIAGDPRNVARVADFRDLAGLAHWACHALASPPPTSPLPPT